MEYMPFTGTGFEAVESDISDVISELSNLLVVKGYTLRSGGSKGISEHFELGANKASRHSSCYERPYSLVTGKEKLAIKEIYLPYRGFNNHNDDAVFSYEEKHIARIKSFLISKKVPEIVKDWANPYVLKDCITRMYQLMGYSLNAPSKSLICWTPDGASGEDTIKPETGITAVSIILAQHFKIPVLNMSNKSTFASIQKRIVEMKNEVAVR